MYIALICYSLYMTYNQACMSYNEASTDRPEMDFFYNYIIRTEFKERFMFVGLLLGGLTIFVLAFSTYKAFLQKEQFFILYELGILLAMGQIAYYITVGEAIAYGTGKGLILKLLPVLIFFAFVFLINMADVIALIKKCEKTQQMKKMGVAILIAIILIIVSIGFVIGDYSTKKKQKYDDFVKGYVHDFGTGGYRDSSFIVNIEFVNLFLGTNYYSEELCCEIDNLVGGGEEAWSNWFQYNRDFDKTVFEIESLYGDEARDYYAWLFSYTVNEKLEQAGFVTEESRTEEVIKNACKEVYIDWEIIVEDNRHK